MQMPSTGAHMGVHQHRRVHSRCASVCTTKPALSSGPFTFIMGEMMACTIPDSYGSSRKTPAFSFLPHLSSKSQPGKLTLPALPTTFLVFHTPETSSCNTDLNTMTRIQGKSVSCMGALTKELLPSYTASRAGASWSCLCSPCTVRKQQPFLQVWFHPSVPSYLSSCYTWPTSSHSSAL